MGRASSRALLVSMRRRTVSIAPRGPAELILKLLTHVCGGHKSKDTLCLRATHFLDFTVCVIV